MTHPGTVVGIDASRNRSGGAIVHLVGMLGSGDPRDHGIERVHLWSYPALLDAVPDEEWLVKHSPAALKRSLPVQMWWQYHSLPREAHARGCQIMLNTDAGTVCPFWPSVVMSRDMLSYEPGEMRRYGLSRAWLRLFALRYVQAWSMKGAAGVIFLTQYAARIIQNINGRLSHIAVIPHGVAPAFRRPPVTRPAGDETPFRCLYVSPLDLYKHQWEVVRAIHGLRQCGYNLSLTLVGGGDGTATRLLQQELSHTDPQREFVKTVGFVPQASLPSILSEADLFIFASSCENMPNTLVEAMASGLPIACARRGPMPEVLQDGGVYFDPEDSASIASAVERLVVDARLRHTVAARAFELASEYSWERCARDTWTFLQRTLAEVAPTGGQFAVAVDQ